MFGQISEKTVCTHLINYEKKNIPLVVRSFLFLFSKPAFGFRVCQSLQVRRCYQRCDRTMSFLKNPHIILGKQIKTVLSS